MSVSRVERSSFRESIGASLATLVQALHDEADLGEREFEADTSLSGIVRGLPEELVGEVMDMVAESEGGASVLRALSTAARTELAVKARVRLEELGEDPTATPRLSVIEAWELAAEDEPSAALTVLCEREGEDGAQAFSFVIETPASGGAIKDGFVTGLGAGRRIVAQLAHAAIEGAVLTAVDPADAAARIAAAAEQGARAGWTPTDDGLRALRIFLRATGAENADALVQALELGDSLEEQIELLEIAELSKAVEALLEECEDWLRGEGLDERRVQAAAEALDLMAQFQLFEERATMGDWTVDTVDEFLLEWVPQDTDLDDVDGFPAAVADAFAFLGANGFLDEEVVASLTRRAARNAARFSAAMQEDDRRGPAAALVAAMQADGVEPWDAEAVGAWIEAFNELSIEERDAILGPALEQRLPEPSPASKRPAKRKTSSRKAQKQARRRNRGS